MGRHWRSCDKWDRNCSICRAAACAATDDFNLSNIAGQDVDRDIDPLLGQAVGHTLGPFDQHQVWRVEVFVDTQLHKFVVVAQPVGVDVIDRHAALILVHQHEGRADHVAAIDAQGHGDRLHQPRLAGPQRSVQAPRRPPRPAPRPAPDRAARCRPRRRE